MQGSLGMYKVLSVPRKLLKVAVSDTPSDSQLAGKTNDTSNIQNLNCQPKASPLLPTGFPHLLETTFLPKIGRRDVGNLPQEKQKAQKTATHPPSPPSPKRIATFLTVNTTN